MGPGLGARLHLGPPGGVFPLLAHSIVFVPLASAHQHPENQKETQAGHSPERTVESQGRREVGHAAMKGMLLFAHVGLEKLTTPPPLSVPLELIKFDGPKTKKIAI